MEFIEIHTESEVSGLSRSEIAGGKCKLYTCLPLVLFSDSEGQERERSAYVPCEFSFYRLPLCHS